ncbi:MAG: hypothetical protein PHW53_04840 [Patescibacteria group bacterium]|nr:hypothetical protein [Patescibacteria group bacterium]
MKTENFHKNCFACGIKSKYGLRLRFTLLDNEIITGKAKLTKHFQGYDGILQGGIISAILDSCMIHLFKMKYNLELKTAKLKICFRRPILINKDILVKGSDIKMREGHFYKANAKILIDELVYAEAEGYFRK